MKFILRSPDLKSNRNNMQAIQFLILTLINSLLRDTYEILDT